VPTLRVAAPRDGSRLKESLREAVLVGDAPTLIRFPKGPVPEDILAIERKEGIDYLHLGKSDDVLLISVGAFARTSVDAAAIVEKKSIGITVIDLRWVAPLPNSLIDMATRFSRVVVLEDGIRHGGIASTLSEKFRDTGITVPIHSLGLPLQFIRHSKPKDIFKDLGLSAEQVAKSIIEWSA
jgi:1-deoxy-D-xylulose-5-phosphate synthase